MKIGNRVIIACCLLGLLLVLLFVFVYFRPDRASDGHGLEGRRDKQHRLSEDKRKYKDIALSMALRTHSNDRDRNEHEPGGHLDGVGDDKGEKESLFPDGGFWDKAEEHFNKSLMKQRRNAEWSYDTEEEGNAFLKERELGDTQILSVDCRDTLCRVDFVHEDDRAIESFKERGLSHEAPWKGERYGRFEEEKGEDGYHSFMYFSPFGFH